MSERAKYLLDESRIPENPLVTGIELIVDGGERSRWEAVVLPKLARCRGRDHRRDAS